MSEIVSLKDAEKKVVRMATNDGLWEILLGLMLLSINASALLQDLLEVPWNYIPVILVIAAGVPAFRAAKKSLILPRIGQVTFSRERRLKVKKVKTVLIGLVLFTWLILLIPVVPGVVTGTTTLPYWFMDAVFGLLVFKFFVLLSSAFEAPRMIFYGLLFGLSLPVDVILQAEFGVQFPVFKVLAGLVITACGVLTLLRFLRRYPMPVDSPSPRLTADNHE